MYGSVHARDIGESRRVACMFSDEYILSIPMEAFLLGVLLLDVLINLIKHLALAQCSHISRRCLCSLDAWSRYCAELFRYADTKRRNFMLLGMLQIFVTLPVRDYLGM